MPFLLPENENNIICYPFDSFPINPSRIIILNQTRARSFSFAGKRLRETQGFHSIKFAFPTESHWNGVNGSWKFFKNSIWVFGVVWPQAGKKKQRMRVYLWSAMWSACPDRLLCQPEQGQEKPNQTTHLRAEATATGAPPSALSAASKSASMSTRMDTPSLSILPPEKLWRIISFALYSIHPSLPPSKYPSIQIFVKKEKKKSIRQRIRPATERFSQTLKMNRICLCIILRRLLLRNFNELLCRKKARLDEEEDNPDLSQLDMEGTTNILMGVQKDIRTLRFMAKQKEKEWNSILKLMKVKEELQAKLMRRKEVLKITCGKSGRSGAASDLQQPTLPAAAPNLQTLINQSLNVIASGKSASFSKNAVNVPHTQSSATSHQVFTLFDYIQRIWFSISARNRIYLLLINNHRLAPRHFQHLEAYLFYENLLIPHQ